MDKTNNKLPLVEIRSNANGGTELFIDGQQLNGVQSFSIEHDPMKKLAPVLTLRMECCKFDVSLGAVPLLPEPWSWFYKPIHDGFTDMEAIKKSADLGQQKSK